jgi:hypothetical protein
LEWVAGFDPDNDDDKKKVNAIKSSFSSIVASYGEMINMMISLNEQRKEKELKALEERAQREGWTNSQLVKGGRATERQV